MERYPDSVHNSVNELIRSGATVEEIEEQYGIGHGTVYKWMYLLRANGEDVAFVKHSDRVKDKAFARFEQGASVETVFEEFSVSRSTIYRWRDEYEEQNPSAPAPAAGCEVPAAGKDEPSGTRRRGPAEAPKDALIKQLKTALADKTLEVDFFRGALREIEARLRSNTGSGVKPSTVG